MWSGYIFSRFMRDLKKVIKVIFRNVDQLKYKKQVKKKFSFPAIEKRLDSTKNVFKEIETALYIFSSLFKAYFNHGW